MIEVAPNCCDLNIKTFPKDQYLTQNNYSEMIEADESQKLCGFEIKTTKTPKKRRQKQKDITKRLSVHELNQILSLSLSILLAAMLQTMHCFTIFLNEHIKTFGF